MLHNVCRGSNTALQVVDGANSSLKLDNSTISLTRAQDIMLGDEGETCCLKRRWIDLSLPRLCA